MRRMNWDAEGGVREGVMQREMRVCVRRIRMRGREGYEGMKGEPRDIGDHGSEVMGSRARKQQGMQDTFIFQNC